jgi:ABC-2 type transport system permease protein
MLFLTVLFENPSHPLILGLTLFPTTSFLTISLRWGLGVIPLWQLIISWLILIGSAVLMTWTAIRVFRIGMLHYGQTLKLKTIARALRSE